MRGSNDGNISSLHPYLKPSFSVAMMLAFRAVWVRSLARKRFLDALLLVKVIIVPTLLFLVWCFLFPAFWEEPMIQCSVSKHLSRGQEFKGRFEETAALRNVYKKGSKVIKSIITFNNGEESVQSGHVMPTLWQIAFSNDRYSSAQAIQPYGALLRKCLHYVRLLQIMHGPHLE